MIIDNSYFNTYSKVAGAKTNLYCSSLDCLNEFIERYEPKYLECVLGYELSKLLKEYLANPTSPNRFEGLVNGGEYVACCGSLSYWSGLVNDEKESPIANYIYFHYQRFLQTQSTIVGEKIVNSENSINTSIAYKQMEAWNIMVDLTDNLKGYLKANIKDFPEYKPCCKSCNLEKIYPILNY